jgi:hypothetical protein
MVHASLRSFPDHARDRMWAQRKHTHKKGKTHTTAAQCYNLQAYPSQVMYYAHCIELRHYMETTKLFVPMHLCLQYRRPPPVDKSTLVAFLPFFPAPFAFCISELSAAVTALLEDMMLANDNAGVANGPAQHKYIVTARSSMEIRF